MSKHLSFKQYILKMKNEDTAKGDFYKDFKEDYRSQKRRDKSDKMPRSFSKLGDLIGYLESRGAALECLEVAELVWKDYESYLAK